jgi:hypothetical protein
MALSGKRVNDGESSAFPIQVSHQELFLFLCVIIFMTLIQTQHVLMPNSPELLTTTSPASRYYHAAYAVGFTQEAMNGN